MTFWARPLHGCNHHTKSSFVRSRRRLGLWRILRSAASEKEQAPDSNMISALAHRLAGWWSPSAAEGSVGPGCITCSVSIRSSLRQELACQILLRSYQDSEGLCQQFCPRHPVIRIGSWGKNVKCHAIRRKVEKIEVEESGLGHQLILGLGDGVHECRSGKRRFHFLFPK